MKLAVFRQNQDVRLGAVTDTGLVDVTAWLRELGEQGIRSTGDCCWSSYLHLVPGHAASLRRFMAKDQSARIDLETVELLAPLSRPGKIVAVGTNYSDHAAEVGRSAPAADTESLAVPRLLGIFPSSIGGPTATVHVPASVKKLDYEAELAVVIGKPGKNIGQDEALAHVFGYMAANDLSAREYQFDINPPQTTRAKSMDCFTPLGPWITTADEVADPQQLWVRCWVNDKLVQDGHTSHMQYGIAALISRISAQFSLHTGDIILTGTPAGCGAFRKPASYLRAGDIVRTELEGLGALTTTIG